MSAESKAAPDPANGGPLPEDLGLRVKTILEMELPPDLPPEERAALVERLRGELDREAQACVRRVSRSFLEERAQAQRTRERARKSAEHPAVERLTLNLRLQHMALFTSCILLIVTGLPIKFHEAAVSKALMDIVGGPSVTGILHRAAALLLTAVGVYHLLYTVASPSGRKDFGLLLPRLQDLRDFVAQIRFFLGLEKERPLFGRFSYIEKFDYWAVYWGMVVMITSGFILWFKEEAINRFGKVLYDIGREAHSDEALLATLAIVVWHFYNVHFNPKRFPGSLTWWHGKISLEEFKEEHPLEYEEWVKNGRLPKEGPPSKEEG